MHHIHKYMRAHTVCDDETVDWVIQGDMYWHTRPNAQNIHSWSLSFGANTRRFREATGRPMHITERIKFIDKIFASQLTAKELETIVRLDTTNYAHITENVFDMVNLRSLIALNMASFTRNFKPDKRVLLYFSTRKAKLKTKAKTVPKGPKAAQG